MVLATSSSDGGCYHEAGCHFVSRAKPENRVQLASPGDAELEGYRPCAFCFPERRQRAGGEGLRLSTDDQEGPAGPSHERGIYRQEYSDAEGNEIFVAIDARGREVARVSVIDPDQRSYVLRKLRSLLNALDPPAWKRHQQASERREELRLIE